MVGQPDHLRRHDPGARRRAGRRWRIRRRRRATASSPSPAPSTRGAPRGKAGTLLLDPEDILINSGLRPLRSDNSLANNDVTITTNPNISDGNGDIELREGAHVAWNANTTLTLSAYHDIIFQPGSSISNGTNANGAGNLILRADNSGTGSGTVVFPSNAESGQVDFSQSTGTVSIYYNPPGEPQTKYQNPTIFACADPCSGHVVVQQLSQVTAYMLVNTANDLQAVTASTSRPNAYALGRDINASSIANFTPIGNGTSAFNGHFRRPGSHDQQSDDRAIGLHNSKHRPVRKHRPYWHRAQSQPDRCQDQRQSKRPIAIGRHARGRECRAQSVNVSVSGPNSQVSGFVNGVGIPGVGAGGLVGQNSGLIANSSSAATVSVGDSNSATASNTAGGLIATNLGTITELVGERQRERRRIQHGRRAGGPERLQPRRGIDHIVVRERRRHRR